MAKDKMTQVDYGDGIEQSEQPWDTKGEDLYSPKISQDDPINEGAWKEYEEKNPRR